MDLKTQSRKEVSERLGVPLDGNELDRNFTGIFIRAKGSEGWDSFDIAVLDKPSLLAFLKSRGGDNRWAEDTVGILLGHGHLHRLPSNLEQLADEAQGD